MSEPESTRVAPDANALPQPDGIGKTSEPATDLLGVWQPYCRSELLTGKRFSHLLILSRWPDVFPS
jgi:hypothetical protein